MLLNIEKPGEQDYECFKEWLVNTVRDVLFVSMQQTCLTHHLPLYGGLVYFDTVITSYRNKTRSNSLDSIENVHIDLTLHHTRTTFDALEENAF